MYVQQVMPLTGKNVPKPLQDLIDLASQQKVETLCQMVNANAFQLFAEMFLRSIVHKRDWRLKHCREHIRQFVSVADESLAMLIFGNNVAEWMDCCASNRENLSTTKEVVEKDGSNPKDKNQKRSSMKTVYTHGGINSDEGLERSRNQEI